MEEEFEYSEKIMGTDLHVSIIHKNKNEAQKIFVEIFKKLQEYENKFSRFIPESELSILNTRKKMIVSEDFIEVLMESKKMFIETNGYFNPLVQIERYGYDKDFKKIKNEVRENYQKSEIEFDIEFDSVLIDEINNKVVLRKNQKLDFGGILKCFVAEKISKQTFSKYPEIKGIIINIGGDIYTQGLNENNQKFNFEIHNPITLETINLELFNESLATSGTYKRKWKIGQKEIHHILDRDGLKNPENKNISISVVSKKGSVAEAYTKYFLSLESGVEIIKKAKEKNLSCVIIKSNGEIIKTNEKIS